MSMLTGERRGGMRRGMTVLGKIPAVPKPINLPSQRLENRGLDPNVDIVPRGTATWGTAGRSPPSANTAAWGNTNTTGTTIAQPPSSPPAWGNAGAPKSTIPPSVANTVWGANTSRPSSAGSTRPGSAGTTRPVSSGGPRPSSAGHLQEIPRPSSAGHQELPPAPNAWGPTGARNSSLGPNQPEDDPMTRPRSAESRHPSTQRVSLLSSSEYPNGPPPGQQWGPGSRKSDEFPQPSRFTLTTGDFPTLGSEKNLRPQQTGEPDNRNSDDRPPSSAGSSQYDDYYQQGARFHDGDANGWPHRDQPFRGPPSVLDRDGYPIPPPGDEQWRIPYHGGPRFPNPEFPPQPPQRYGPGPGSYNRHDGYGGPGGPPGGQFMRPERPGHHFGGPGMFHGPPMDPYYYQGPNYNMDDRLWQGGPPGRFGGFQPAPAHHEFGRPIGPRPRIPPHGPAYGQESEGGLHSGYRDSRDGGKSKDGESSSGRSEGDHRRVENKPGGEPKRMIHSRPYGHKDWGNDEPMDFSKPVFEKEPTGPPARNHKVTFKAEPTVADVAILKKPQQPKPEEGEAEVMDTAAGVLGKCPPAAAAASEKQEAADDGSSKAKGKLVAQEQKQGDSEAGNEVGNVAYDYGAQRAKMKEIAAQRARQLQEEEEERIKEQKAKALAKLEELNRRSAAAPRDEVVPPAAAAATPAAETAEAAADEDEAAEESEDAKAAATAATPSKPEHAKRERGGKRRKGGRGGKNRQKAEAGPNEAGGEPAAAATAAVEAEPPVEPPAVAPAPPEEGSSSRGPAEKSGRRYQRRPQGARRPSKPQDVRVADKTQPDGMVWAPIRPNTAGGKSEDSNEERAPPRSRRAEMERYTPKPVKQHQGHGENEQRPATAPSSDGHNNGGRGSGENNGGRRDGPDGRPRSNGSWRQRQQNFERGAENRPPVNEGGGGGGGGGGRHHRDSDRPAAAGRSGFRNADKDRPHRENGVVYQQKSTSPRQQQQQQQDQAVPEQQNHNPNPRQQPQQKGQGQYPHHHKGSSANNNETWRGENSSNGNHGGSQWNANEGRGGDGGRDGNRGEGRGGHHHPPRRGRGFGRGSGPRAADLGNRLDKQRMVIDATGGAVPNQVVG